MHLSGGDRFWEVSTTLRRIIVKTFSFLSNSLKKTEVYPIFDTPTDLICPLIANPLLHFHLPEADDTTIYFFSVFCSQNHTPGL